MKISREDEFEFINKLSSGIGIYTLEQGVPHQIFLNDGYYKMMGLKREERLQFFGENTMNVVFDEDKPIIYRALKKAIAGDGVFRVTIRLKISETDMRWIQLDGNLTDYQDAKQTFYIIFTDISEIKNAEAELEKTKSSLISALKVSKQLCFEFDPVLRSAEGYTHIELFGLPNKIENYPESLIEAGLFHPDDIKTVRETIKKVDEGIDNISCQVRIRLTDTFKWYVCDFEKFYDERKGYNIALCNIRDITVFRQVSDSYHRQIESILRFNPDVIAVFHVNITKDICDSCTTAYENVKKLKSAGTLSGLVKMAADQLETNEEIEEFNNAFSIEKMKNSFNQGMQTIKFKHRFLLEDNDFRWLKTSVEFMSNPISGDLEGIIYTVDNSNNELKSLVLKEITMTDYKQVCVFYKNENQYYILNNFDGDFIVQRKNFWDDCINNFLDEINLDDRNTLMEKINSKDVYSALENKHSKKYIFHLDSKINRRYQLAFSYIDRNRGLVMAAARDITDESLMQELSYKNEHDALTGLYNREKSMLEVNKLIGEHPDEKFFMVHFDIERFRLYNSFFGDNEGDNLLKYISNMFRELKKTHKYGVYGRIEADVFLLFFPESERVIEKNIEYIHNKLLGYRNDFVISGAAGVFFSDKGGHLSGEEMFNRATIAAKHGKSRFSSAITCFDDNMSAQLNAENEIVLETIKGISERQFVVYLQPKYKLFTGEPFGAEALVRWLHPQKGIIPPGKFIPLFETNGFITTLDQYMWEEVCILIRKWLDEGKEVMPISVNVSRVSMYSPQTVPYLKQLVEIYNIPMELFNLELTESAYMDDPDSMKKRLEELRSFGFKIMMDDFGSGYSSLNMLREIPVDYLKVDRQFLESIDQSKKSRLVLASVVHMAARLGIPVITEGVETDEQREFLISIGCDYVQGYLYAKPMPVADYEKKIIDDKEFFINKDHHEEAKITKITMDMDAEIRKFANLIPYGLAFVEYVSDSFTYITGNLKFQQVFGMGNDVCDEDIIVGNHLTEEGYETLKNTYKKVADTALPSECFILWKHDDGNSIYYLVSVQYIGKNVFSTIMTCTFIDLSEVRYETQRAIRSSQKFIGTKNVYTIEEINDYIHMLNQSFDNVRLVRPADTKVIKITDDMRSIIEKESCYSFWGKSCRCDNCSSTKCVKKRENIYKIENNGDDMYLVASHPLRMYNKEGDTISDVAVETFTKLSNELIDIIGSGEVIKNEALLHQYRKLIYLDSLTGCYNRRYFSELKFIKQPDLGFEKGQDVTFVMINIIGFRKINEKFGRDIGDRVLIITADTLSANAREIDSVIRFGGDQFLVVLYNCPEEQIFSEMQRYVNIFSTLHYSEDEAINVKVGYSFRKKFRAGVKDIQKMIRETDENIYEHE